MAKLSTVVGYGEPVETAPGVWDMAITEHPYYGEIIRKASTLEPGDGLNSNVTIGNQISIVADERAREHFSKIKYVTWEGERWIVTSVEVRRPRLILSLGSVYNGPTPAP